MQFFSRRLLSSMVVSLPLVLACSSSDGGSAPAAAADAGTSSDAAVSDSASGSDAAVANDASKPSTGPCAFEVTGDRTYPTTDAIACTGYLKQVAGMGSYDINVAAAYESATSENVNLGFTLSSPTPPAAGDTWTMNQTTHTGKVTLTVTKGTDGAIWSASDQDNATVTDAVKITFVSATKTAATQRPQDIYYVFEVMLEATLPGRTAGATSVKVTGHFKLTALPLGA